MNFVIGSLFPKNKEGKPNVQFSKSIEIVELEEGQFILTKNGKEKSKRNNRLVSHINITSEPVSIKNASSFIEDWYKKEITSIYNDDGSVDTSSIFGGVYNTIVNQKWTKRPISSQ